MQAGWGRKGQTSPVHFDVHSHSSGAKIFFFFSFFGADPFELCTTTKYCISRATEMCFPPSFQKVRMHQAKPTKRYLRNAEDQDLRNLRLFEQNRSDPAMTLWDDCVGGLGRCIHRSGTDLSFHGQPSPVLPISGL